MVKNVLLFIRMVRGGKIGNVSSDVFILCWKMFIYCLRVFRALDLKNFAKIAKMEIFIMEILALILVLFAIDGRWDIVLTLSGLGVLTTILLCML